jgi:hypothetical protein
VDPKDEAALAAGLPPVDGVDLWPMLSGANTTSPRAVVPLSNEVLIVGSLKYIQSSQSEGIWQSALYPNASTNCSAQDAVHTPGPLLFDIIKDPEERHNLIQSEPQAAARLAAQLKEIAATTFVRDRGKSDPAACAWKAAHQNFWGPWLGDW